jgi:hypothetical protein
MLVWKYWYVFLPYILINLMNRITHFPAFYSLLPGSKFFQTFHPSLSLIDKNCHIAHSFQCFSNSFIIWVISLGIKNYVNIMKKKQRVTLYLYIDNLMAICKNCQS